MVFIDNTYLLKRSKRAQKVRITVYPDCRVIVTIPWKCSSAVANNFVTSNSEWLKSKLNYFRSCPSSKTSNYNPNKFRDVKDKVLRNIKERIDFFNSLFSFNYNRITIRDTKTRWGSCSKKRNINFNYKIIYLEPKLRDYIIIHELCHLVELNHSKRFWDIVEKIIPGHKILRSELRTKSLN